MSFRSARTQTESPYPKLYEASSRLRLLRRRFTCGLAN